jgi:predicted ATPase
LEAEERPSVVRICQMVEGMPLGIELAAAWVPVLTCREIAHEIERGMDFLATTMRDVPERQRSLRAAFDHSRCEPAVTPGVGLQIARAPGGEWAL